MVLVSTLQYQVLGPVVLCTWYLALTLTLPPTALVCCKAFILSHKSCILFCLCNRASFLLPMLLGLGWDRCSFTFFLVGWNHFHTFLGRTSIKILCTFKNFLAALAALYLTLVSQWVSDCHFIIWTQRVTFGT